MTAAERAPATDCAIIVFARVPAPGRAKTRLVPALGAQGAASLARRMLVHAVEAACEARVGPVTLCAAGDTGDGWLAGLAAQAGIALDGQGEGGLGERMHRALTGALARHSCALLVGTDVPALDATLLRRACAALASNDAVFVPALDGGYVLVGLQRPAPGLFEDIAWSTPGVMQATRERARSLGLRIAELPAVADVDVPDDLVHVPADWLAELRAAVDAPARRR